MTQGMSRDPYSDDYMREERRVNDAYDRGFREAMKKYIDLDILRRSDDPEDISISELLKRAPQGAIVVLNPGTYSFIEGVPPHIGGISGPPLT